MIRARIAQHLTNDVTMQITGGMPIYIEFAGWSIKPFLESFDTGPAPWPLTPERIRKDERRIHDGPAPEGDEAREMEEYPSSVEFHRWCDPENQRLLEQVLCTGRFVDWYYTNAVLIPATADWESVAHALKLVYHARMVRDDVLRAAMEVSRELGWCGIQVNEWSWMFVFADGVIARALEFVQRRDTSGNAYRVRGRDGELWAEPRAE
jgi:hypothetical protein